MRENGDHLKKTLDKDNALHHILLITQCVIYDKRAHNRRAQTQTS